MKLNKISKSIRKETEYNLILDSDGYKVSHHLQYPEGSEALFSYIESRGGKFDKVLFVGLQYILQKYLETPITMEMIDEAEDYITKYGLGESFNRKGWEYIVNQYDGRIPVEIRAVPEGTIVPTKNVLVTMYCDDPQASWVVSYIETMLLRVWAPITTATTSLHVKEIIMKYAKQTSGLNTDKLFDTDPYSPLLFSLHDFGARGGSSYETVSLNGVGHLVNFYGTDTMSALKLAREHYGVDVAGASIDASEHSTMTVLGPDGEVHMFKRMVDQFGNRMAFSCVSDGFDIFKAITEKWGKELYDEVVNMNAMLVIRPDSGDPVEVPVKCVEMLDEIFGSEVNANGFKVLKHVRVIQGDGISIKEVQEICELLVEKGYCVTNMAFGMGGGLIQSGTRDTQKFACKNSWMRINGESVNVFKDPVTDPGKKSKKGRMTLIEVDNGKTLETVTELTDDVINDPSLLPGKEVLETVFNGVVTKTYTLDDIRKRAETYINI